jgi:outer membrane biosynthesis protein TonB
MYKEQTNPALMYMIAGALSLFIHVSLFLLPWLMNLHFGFTSPVIAAAKGRTAVDISFMRPAPPKPQHAQAPSTETVRKPVMPTAPRITIAATKPISISLADVLEKPQSPSPAAQITPAPDDLPPTLSPPDNTQETGVNFGSQDQGVTAPAIAPDNGKPDYPRSCLEGFHKPDRSPCEGTTKFLVKVDAEGRAIEISLLETAGCQHLDASARRWLSKAYILPGTKNGKPVESSKIFDIRFYVVEYYSADK